MQNKQMVQYECFRKKGKFFSKTPYETCTNTACVFASLSSLLMLKYVYGYGNIVYRVIRHPISPALEEIIIFRRYRKNKPEKIVFTLPRGR